MGTAAWAAPVSCVHRSALLGQSLTWRSLGRSLLADFIACSARLRLAAEVAGEPPAACVQINQFIRTVVRFPQSISKISDAGCRASRE